MRASGLLAAALCVAAPAAAASGSQLDTWQDMRWAQTPAWAMARPTPGYLKARVRWILAGLRGARAWEEAPLMVQSFACGPKTPLAEVAARSSAPMNDPLIPPIECLAHETGEWGLCELFRREPGYSIGAAICGTDVYGREFVRSYAAGRPHRGLCRAYLAATFDGMDHLGRDLAGRVSAAGWDRLCSALEKDLREGTLDVCRQVVIEIAAVVSSSEAVHLQMEYLRNVCQPDIGAFTQGAASCVATSNPFDETQCRTNARVAAALKRGDGALCGSDWLCASAFGRKAGSCSGQIESALRGACPRLTGPGPIPDPPDAARAAQAFAQEIGLLDDAAAGLPPDAELAALTAEVRTAARARELSVPEPAPGVARTSPRP